ALHHPAIIGEIERVEKELDGAGRVLVRPSGTEPLIRVMVEAETEEDCEKYVDELIDVIERNAYAIRKEAACYCITRVASFHLFKKCIRYNNGNGFTNKYFVLDIFCTYDKVIGDVF